MQYLSDADGLELARVVEFLPVYSDTTRKLVVMVQTDTPPQVGSHLVVRDQTGQVLARFVCQHARPWNGNTVRIIGESCE